MKKVLLGFSGGVDSTASAAILRNQGYDVRLLTLDTAGNREQIEKARSVAAKLGMELEVADVRQLFSESVVNYFTGSYCRGETPAPCTVCNELVKWKTLYDKVVERGYDNIATGHYFRVEDRGGKYHVRKGADPVKDQSYFLWSLPQRYLAMALTPMGDRFKNDVKRSHDHLVGGAESMGVCFLNGLSYGDFLRDRVPSIRSGAVLDRSGGVVGSHEGCALYTIGQKRGFECTVAGAVVTGIDAAANTLTVGTDSDLYSTVLELDGCRVVDLERLLDSPRVTVKIRGLGRNPEGYVKVTVSGDGYEAGGGSGDPYCGCGNPGGDCSSNAGSSCGFSGSGCGFSGSGCGSYGNFGGSSGSGSSDNPSNSGSSENHNTLRLHVALSDPAWAAAKGQPVVFYEDDIVFGGGYLSDYR